MTQAAEDVGRSRCVFFSLSQKQILMFFMMSFYVQLINIVLLMKKTLFLIFKLVFKIKKN